MIVAGMFELSGPAISQETALERERDTTACEEAFAELVRRQSRFAFQVAHAVLRNVQDAEDVVQECFLKLYRAGSWRQMENERAFLARVVWRHAVGRRSRSAEKLSAPEPVSTANPEQIAVTEDLKQLAHRLIEALPPDLREPLLLSAIEELNSEEIGQILALPAATVRNRLMRARHVLREKLASRLEVRGGR
jgi:RNA polymerase sigma-70 factor, ECF subfamily